MSFSEASFKQIIYKENQLEVPKKNRYIKYKANNWWRIYKKCQQPNEQWPP